MVDAKSHQLQCVVVSPERALFDEPADFVAIPMYDGELGVLPGRAALIGRLGYGELRIVQGAHTKRYYIDSGFVQVRDNTVSVLTSRAVPVEEIKPEVVQQALNQAQEGLSKAVGDAAQQAELTRQDKLRSQLRVAQHARAAGHHA